MVIESWKECPLPWMVGAGRCLLLLLGRRRRSPVTIRFESPSDLRWFHVDRKDVRSFLL